MNYTQYVASYSLDKMRCRVKAQQDTKGVHASF